MFDETTIPELAATLKEGGVAVIPTDTIYGVVGCALNTSTVEKIYRLKRRTPTKPFIILVSDLNDIEQFGIKVTSPLKAQLANYWPGPVSVILECKDPQFAYLHRGTKSLAFRLPDNDTLRSLIQHSGPLVAPSANPEGLTPSETIEEAKGYFKSGVDTYLEGPTKARPSKIIRITGGVVEVIRD